MGKGIEVRYKKLFDGANGRPTCCRTSDCCTEFDSNGINAPEKL